ncbi:MAG TPA: AEC family transporter [bacterium]
MWLRALFGLGLVVGSLGLGYALRKGGVLDEARASRIVQLAVRGLAPAVLCLSLWRMPLRSVEPWLLPVLGLAVSAAMLLPAVFYVRRSAMSRPQAGSFYTCAYFSNVGYFGAFIAFALFGEEAYALCLLYLAFFPVAFYSLGFWMAARYGQPREAGEGARILRGELRLYPLGGMLAGIALSLAGVARPPVLEAVNHALIPLETGLYLLAIGSQVSLRPPRQWWSACLVMCAIKFIWAPLVALALTALAGLEGLMRLVVLLEASTPVAISPLMLPMLFGLDRRFSSALWLVTTILAVPWFLVLLPILVRNFF